MHIHATPKDARRFDLSTPTPLSDGGSWAAILIERDTVLVCARLGLRP